MSTTFNLWPRATIEGNLVALPLHSSKEYVTLQCELIDLLGQEGPTTWELDLNELTVHDDKVAMLVALKWK